ncbi:MAG: hypothetical protein A2X56_00140 [Nitrospirae bacterium GWC2_57_13]|jgi:hypothetical protein|nr:MAG: hypothetical protein A2X56_00140 [Nitrospirae bacterium GWC2_57_13]
MSTVIPQADSFGLPVNPDTAFSTPKGEFKERIKKRQLKMLEKYQDLLKQFLEPGEEILLAMRGCSPMSFIEQLTVGWVILLIKRCTLIVTNKRILHFPAKMDFSPKRSISQIRYGDVDTIKPAGFLGSRFTVRYKNGVKETFLYVKESRKLKAIMPKLKLQGEPTSLFRSRHHLCPKCAVPLEPGVYKCWKCGMEFKSMKTAMALSIFLPGGGYFYTGHPFLGLGDAIGEIILLVVVAFSAYNVVFGTADPVGDLMLLAIFGVLLVFEKIMTVYHAKHFVKEYIPVEKDFQPMKGT